MICPTVKSFNVYFFQFTGKQQQNKPDIIYNIILFIWYVRLVFIFKSLELHYILKTVFAKIQFIIQSRSVGNDHSPTHQRRVEISGGE
jgi:hypothetical protein